MNQDENPVTTFPIEKRINTKLLIDERAALYIQKGSQKNKGLRIRSGNVKS